MICKAIDKKYPLDILLLSDSSTQRDVGLRVFLKFVRWLMDSVFKLPTPSLPELIYDGL